MEKIIKATNLEELFMNLSFYFVKRYTKGQKKRAFVYLNDELTDQSSHVNISIEYEKIGSTVVYFYLIGNMKTAKKIFLTPFDTPKKSKLRNFTYYPFNEKKNFRNEKINIALILIEKVMLILLILLGVLLLPIENKVLVSFVAIVITSLLKDKCIGSAPNFNKSTASLSMLIHMAKMEIDGIAYVLLDHTAENHAGLKMFLKKYEKDVQNKEVVFMDCLASGERLFLRTDSKLKEIPLETGANARTINFNQGTKPSLFQLHNNLKLLYGGKFEGGEVIVKDICSKKDSKINVERLKKIEDWLIS